MIVLMYRDNPTPFFEVLGVSDNGRKIQVRRLTGDADQRTSVCFVDKALYREHGYYPKEIDDALIPELCP